MRLGGLAGLVTGDPMDEATTLAPLSSQQALRNLVNQVDRSVAAGARPRGRPPRPGLIECAPAAPSRGDLETAEAYGRRVAEITLRFAHGPG